MLSREKIKNAIPESVESVELPDWTSRSAGKVRDIYHWNTNRILITSDRFSAFDRVLGLIPYKGQVLNQLSVWWFRQTADLVANHLIAAPDPNVMVVHEASPLPLEIVVRGYITGVTDTSLWTLYERGEREMYGLTLPDGLNKNDLLPEPVITPTTKSHSGHDMRISPAEIFEQKILEPLEWDYIKGTALALFKRGQKLAKRAGLVLVDTKYEFGIYEGQLILIDEIHTPDSSRYWMKDKFDENGDPLNYDKEFLRRWLVDQGYRGEGAAPLLPESIIVEVAARYIEVYQRLTGQTFEPGETPALARIARNMRNYRESQV